MRGDAPSSQPSPASGEKERAAATAAHRIVIDQQTGSRRRGPVFLRARLAANVLRRLASGVKLIFLHGKPASGKLTVARELLRRVPGRLFDNHAAIDLARTLFDFGAPGFWELVQEVRLVALQAAVRQGVPLVVMTYCYVEPDDQVALAQFETAVQRDGGELLPVYLQCDPAEAAQRIGNPERPARGKISSTQGLEQFCAAYNLTSVPRDHCLMLDTISVPPEVTAQAILRHFRLDSRANDGAAVATCRST
jgi:hypothetical protein